MPQLLGFIIAIVIGVLVGQDADKRGMNAWGWGIFSACIPLLALIIYFIVRKPKVEGR